MHSSINKSAGHRTFDSQLAGSSPGLAPPRSGLRQARPLLAPKCLSPNSIIWYRPRSSDAFRLGR